MSRGTHAADRVNYTVCGSAFFLPYGDAIAQTCVTSPPYFGMRDYGIAGQVGAEVSLTDYVARIVVAMREVWRVLKPDGTLWLNLGDTYTSGGRRTRAVDAKVKGRAMNYRAPTPLGLKPKDLIGVPWRVAFALQEDGWWLRSDVIWEKPNAMPESVEDRPTNSHEHLFLLSKQPRYYYDAEAISEPSGGNKGNNFGTDYHRHVKKGLGTGPRSVKATRNSRTVWSIATQPYRGAHFAVMSSGLARKAILAGSRAGDIVLDPFSGAGTTAMVALREGRRAIGTELNPAYLRLLAGRILPSS